MATSKLHSWADKRAEPPRDGEFGLQAELSSEERISGLLERTAWRLAAASVAAWDSVMRYPVLAASLAVGTGVVLSSVYLISPPG